MHDELISLYADVILDDLLNIQKGEALSINTEEDDFEIARVIANKALERTFSTVKIVQTVNGRPSEVIDFDPDITKAISSSSFAMLRLDHKKPIVEEENTLDVIVEKDDLKAMQKLGHLADPILLNRRISVPWLSIPVYDLKDPRWNEIDSFVHSDIKNAILVSDYRKNYLSHLDIHTLHITNENTDLKIYLEDGLSFIGCSTKLRNSRSFVSSKDFDLLSITVNSLKTEGFVKADATILGKKQTLDLTFKDGKIIKYSPSKELDRLLSLDPLLRQIGYISLRDKQVILNMGGALLDCFDKEPETEDEIPDYFNQSLLTIKFELSDNANITVTDCSDKKTELVRKGYFLE